MPDPVWPFILCGAALFLAGALLAAAVKPFRRGLEAACNAFLRITRIRPDAGRESVSEEQLRALMDISEEKGAMEADEKEMIENVFDFNDTVAEDVICLLYTSCTGRCRAGCAGSRPSPRGWAGRSR